MVLAYQEILARLGYVAVEKDFVGVDGKGQLLVWVGYNYCDYYPQSHKLTNEK
jgi:hypothetical protein